MTSLVIRAGRVADALSLAPRLRPEDATELTLARGPDVERTLLDSILFSSECYTAEEDGKVIAIGGFGSVTTNGSCVGIPWMVGSPECLKYPKKLVEYGLASVARWESMCDVMSNVTHKDNVVHHRWLRRIGFSFLPNEVPVGDSGAPFLQFYRHSKCVSQQPSPQ